MENQRPLAAVDSQACAPEQEVARSSPLLRPCDMVTFVGTCLRAGAVMRGARTASLLVLRAGAGSLRSPAVSLTA
jgi:hypothetical protein